MTCNQIESQISLVSVKREKRNYNMHKRLMSYAV